LIDFLLIDCLKRSIWFGFKELARTPFGLSPFRRVLERSVDGVLFRHHQATRRENKHISAENNTKTNSIHTIEPQ